MRRRRRRKGKRGKEEGEEGGEEEEEEEKKRKGRRRKWGGGEEGEEEWEEQEKGEEEKGKRKERKKKDGHNPMPCSLGWPSWSREPEPLDPPPGFLPAWPILGFCAEMTGNGKCLERIPGVKSWKQLGVSEPVLAMVDGVLWAQDWLLWRFMGKLNCC